MSQDDDSEVLDEIQEMHKPTNHLLNDMMLTVRWLSMRQEKTWRPATDVYETDEAVIIKAEIAGMRDQDFSISLSNRNLVITGVRSDSDVKLAYQQLEIPYGRFRTQVFLPYAVDQDKITASYKNGFLTVVLPKAQPVSIELKGAQMSRQDVQEE
ncbi:MAG: Hsp20/alpha crystallin family protein [Anaerolineae bacterium]|nr:Hsp20/alpha crystallin family protein [Anaerolineae bacterium]